MTSVPINLITERIIQVSDRMHITIEELTVVANRLTLIAEQMDRTFEGNRTTEHLRSLAQAMEGTAERLSYRW